MCNPALAVLAVTSAIQASQQSKAARKTNQFNSEQSKRVVDSANRAAKTRYKGLIARSKEARQLAADETRSLTSQALKASGIARLEGAGASLGGVLSNLAAQRATGVSGIARREAFADAQTELEFDATREQARGRILSSVRPRVGGGEFFNAALSVAGAAAGGFGSEDGGFFSSKTT